MLLEITWMCKSWFVVCSWVAMSFCSEIRALWTFDWDVRIKFFHWSTRLCAGEFNLSLYPLRRWLLRGFRISFDGPRKSEEWSFKADPFCGAHGDLVLLHKTMFREIPLYGKTWAMAKPRKQGVKTYRPWFIADPRQLSPKFELAPIPSIKPLPQIRLRVRAHSTQ